MGATDGTEKAKATGHYRCSCSACYRWKQEKIATFRRRLRNRRAKKVAS